MTHAGGTGAALNPTVVVVNDAPDEAVDVRADQLASADRLIASAKAKVAKQKRHLSTAPKGKKKRQREHLAAAEKALAQAIAAKEGI